MFIEQRPIWTRPPPGGPWVLSLCHIQSPRAHGPPDGGRSRSLLDSINMASMNESFVSSTNVNAVIRVVSSATLEAETHPELKSSRAPGPEDLIEAARRLAESRGVRKIAAVAGQVGDVKEVEYLADRNQAVPLLKDERAA